MRKFTILLAFLLFAAACGNSPSPTTDETTKSTVTSPTPTTSVKSTDSATSTTAVAVTTTATPATSTTQIEVETGYEASLKKFHEAKALMLSSGDFGPFDCAASIVGADRATEFMSADPTAEELSLLEPCFDDFVPQTEQAAPPTTVKHGAPPTTSAPAVPCVERPLTALPIPRESLAATVPLGHINVPEHTIPTDHVYLVLPGYSEGASPAVALSSPGDLTLYRVTRTRYDVVGDTESYSDWGLVFSVCEGRDLRFGHVSTVSDQIVEATTNAPEYCNVGGYAAMQFEYCGFELYDAWERLDFRVSFEEGDAIGTLGGLTTPNTQLDLWAYDYNLGPMAFINLDRQPSDAQHAVCPFDWFVEDIRLLLYSMRQELNGRVADAQVGCGKIAQDVAGTAKGIWYTVQEVQGDWMDNLALVEDNTRSDHQLIAVASTVAEASDWIFKKESSGRINLDFAKVEAGSGIYCYHEFTADSRTSGPPSAANRVLIEVSSSEVLTIELQSGSCSGNDSFSSPTEYQR
jgi:hypothetical protein